MIDHPEVLDDAAELAARWHATVEAHIAGQLRDCAHRLAAHHLAHALMVATSMEGVGSAVKYLNQVRT
jgi:hypothetical protein